MGRAEGGSGLWWWGGAGNTLLRALRTGRGGKRWRWGAGNERGVKGAVSGSVQRDEATAFISRWPTPLGWVLFVPVPKPQPGGVLPSLGSHRPSPVPQPLGTQTPQTVLPALALGHPTGGASPREGQNPKKTPGRIPWRGFGVGGGPAGSLAVPHGTVLLGGSVKRFLPAT